MSGDPEAASDTALRVLCLDIEGGYGGSSRSLCEVLRHVDRRRISPEVWCRRSGPVQDAYRELGIPCRVAPAMPKVSSLPRLSRNMYVYGLYLRDFLRAGQFRHDLVVEIERHFDLVHFNHEGLFLLARWLRGRVRVPFTMHIRTNLRDTGFARWQNRVTAHTMQHLIYITENERETLERQSGMAPAGSVIFNVASPLADDLGPDPRIPDDGRLKICCLSNYAWDRGIDRLINVAQALKMLNHAEKVLFVIAGRMTLTRSMPGELGRIGAKGGTLADYAANRGVADMFLFLGHVAEPERVLAGCDLLAKPTRHDNPWGRDIVEAMAAAKPVLTVGTWSTLVETGETGILPPVFDAEDLACAIVTLAANPAARRRMGDAARKRIQRLCNGPDRAAELASLWERVAAGQV